MSNESFVWDDIPNDDEKEQKSLYNMFNEIPEDDEESEKNIDKHKVDKKKTSDFKMSKKGKVLIAIVTIIIMIMLYLLIPYNKINDINVNKLYFSTKEDVIDVSGLELKKYYNKIDLRNIKIKLKDSNLGIVKSKYNYKKKLLDVNIQEVKPLAMGDDGKMYYYEKNKISSTKEKSYDVPKMVDLDKKQQKKLLISLSKLNYDIIKEITAITIIKDIDNRDLVLFQMKNGNYIEIYMSQIAEKMPYYLQMQQIIDKKTNGKPGVIHLDLGDYYEPFK